MKCINLKKKGIILLCWVLFLWGIITMGIFLNQASAAESIKLKLADSFPTKHILSIEGAVYWANKVEELTNGQIKFDYYPAQQLGKAKDLLDIVRTKVADVAYVAPAYVSSRMPLSTIGMLPGLFDTSQSGTKAYWSVMKQRLEKEEFLKNGIRPMWAVTLPTYKIVTKDKPIPSIESLHNLKIRTGGATQEFMIKQLGAIPVSTPAPEVYMAIQRGTIDGTTGPYSSMRPYKMEELIRYAANCSVGSFVVTYSINESVWQSLPDSAKHAMEEAGKDTMLHLSKALDERELSEKQKVEEYGIKVYNWSKEDLAKQTLAAKAVANIWATKLDERGLGATQLLGLFMKDLGL